MVHLNLFLLLVLTMTSMAANFDWIGSLRNKHRPTKIVEEIIYKGPKGIIRFNKKEDTLTLFCVNRDLLNETFPPLEKIISTSKLILFECSLPLAPIVDTLKSLNINTSSIEVLWLTSTQKEPLPEANYTDGLNIRELNIETPNIHSKDYLLNNPYFLAPLVNLKSLHVHGATLPGIPNNVHLVKLNLFLRANVKQWQNCQYLEELSMRFEVGENIASPWPKNCSRLKKLNLRGMSSDAVHKVDSVLKTGTANLLLLQIEECEIKDLPIEILIAAKNLTHLNLTRNQLSDDSLNKFPQMSFLEVLDLSHNSIIGLFLNDMVKQMPRLQQLNLDYNSIGSPFCSSFTSVSTFVSNVPSLEILSLNGNLIHEEACFKGLHFRKLIYLGLDGPLSKFVTRVKNLRLQDFPTTDASNLVIDLKKRLIEHVEFEPKDYELIKTGNLTSFWGTQNNTSNLTLLINSINCDCDNYWFARTLEENPEFVSLPKTRCDKINTTFAEESLNTFNCSRREFDKCVVRTAETPTFTGENEFKNVTVECHDIKTQSIYYPIDDYNGDSYKIIGLNISNNSITSLDDFFFPDTIEWIDLRGNLISRLSANESLKLFASPQRQVWLNRNLLICDCENKLMLDALHQHRYQIVDFDELICSDSGEVLSSVTSYEVCQIQLRVILGILGVIVVVLLVIFALLWHFRVYVRIYLYSRGWCLSCLNEDDFELDRPYDAFVSFSHADWEYVTEKLLPKLESEPNSYRVCVHYRDWVVGDWIPSQIMRSVGLSKRTIIVLSRNFIRSLWGSLEFRYAVASAAKEGRPRLLVLVLDDVLEEDLDPELQAYVSYNTFLHTTDPWFWEKLRYAMPHQKQFSGNTQTPPTNVADGCGIIDTNNREVVIMETLEI